MSICIKIYQMRAHSPHFSLHFMQKLLLFSKQEQNTLFFLFILNILNFD